jgi:non-specific serine/threonine protein kinase
MSVFTQFREITPLHDFPASIFDDWPRPYGSVPVKAVPGLVDAFQKRDTYIPFMVLSLKAGGVGLNSTEANHVVHFDRWWNPAVENQATDRAFRIGQKKTSSVHKFITQGTIEEKSMPCWKKSPRMSEWRLPLAVKGGSPNWTTTN